MSGGQAEVLAAYPDDPDGYCDVCGARWDDHDDQACEAAAADAKDTAP